ncbi:MAG: hypothetical protein AAF711_08895 [Planctomycetota bacterium]
MNRIWIPAAVLAFIIAMISFDHIQAQGPDETGKDNTSIEFESTRERFVIITGEITRLENEDGRENPPTVRRVDTVMLDTWSGKSWRLSYSKSGSYRWEEIPGKRPEAVR